MSNNLRYNWIEEDSKWELELWEKTLHLRNVEGKSLSTCDSHRDEELSLKNLCSNIGWWKLTSLDRKRSISKKWVHLENEDEEAERMKEEIPSSKVL